MLSLLRSTFWSLLALILLQIPALGQEPVDDVKIRAQVETFLTGYHDAAAAADAERYLGCFRKDAIILGTAPGERFGIDAFRSMVLQAFSGGRGWKTVPFEMNVRVSDDHSTAWFDERLRRESGMEMRATGVLRRGPEGWKIVQLNNVFPVPNERAMKLAAKIRKAVPMPSESIPKNSPAAKVLVEFHRAGAEADLEGYLGYLADDAVSMGTDAPERWTRSGVRELLKPLFGMGLVLDTNLVVLNITESEDGRFAWFDARLNKPSLCEIRGSGLLRRGTNGWKIVQYNRAFPVPNDLIEFIDGGNTFTTPLEVAALREDFALLRRTLEEWHPALYVYESRKAIDRMFEQTMAGIKEPMTALRFETLISPVIARVHCMHTRVLRTGPHEAARRRASTYLPVEPQVIDGRLYVRTNYIDDPAELESSLLKPGTELLQINGMTAGKVIARLLAVIPSDGQILSHKITEVNDGFSLLYATHLGSPKQFDLRVRKLGTEEVHELSVPALSYDRWIAMVMDRGPKRLLGFRPALETRILPAEDVAILTHPTFDPVEPARFVESLEAFFARLDEGGIGNLIVDLRNNPGGDPFHGAMLVSYLVDEPFTYLQFNRDENSTLDAMAMSKYVMARPPAEHHFKGKVYMLIGGRNTSTAGHVISVLKQQGRVVFIGQESGATWTCNDNSRDIILPATGIRVHIARTTYGAAVKGFAAGISIQPDHEVHPTVEDMLAGRDPEMELALRLSREED